VLVPLGPCVHKVVTAQGVELVVRELARLLDVEANLAHAASLLLGRQTVQMRTVYATCAAFMPACPNDPVSVMRAAADPGGGPVGSRSDPQPTPTGPVGFQLLNDISGENGIIPDKK
jgi:hypothetical protein